MSSGIERRAKRDLWSYCLNDVQFYEDLSNYIPKSTSYYELLQRYLPQTYQIIKKSLWYHVFPGNLSLEPQGFKIHISATSRTALVVMECVLPLLVEHMVSFKLVVDPFMLDCVNSKNFSRGGSGKFITVYPNRAQLEPLLDQLEKTTSGLRGPYILSDKPYKESRTIFYRYGGFIPRYHLNVFGEKEPVIDSSDGKEIPDLRRPYFGLPEGVSDPFESPVPTRQNSIVLNERFSVEGTITQSNAGGVYRARDLATNKPVIIKEARPLINSSTRHELDAMETLRKEHRVLAALQETPYVPRLLDFFQEWEHLFLVEEMIDGILMSSFRASENFSLLLNRKTIPEDVVEFCLRVRTIASNLAQAIKDFHARGILLGDLSPANIFIDPATLKVTFIDFEGCHFLGEDFSGTPAKSIDSMVTLGFVSPDRLTGNIPSTLDDFYSLGCLIYNLIFPIQVFFHLNPAASDLFIQEITTDYGLPEDLRLAILDLLHHRPESGLDRLEFKGGVNAPSSSSASSTPSSPDLEGVISNITGFILQTANPERKDRLWPADYRVFNTNPLNLAYGALGTSLALKRLLGKLPEHIVEWLSHCQLNLRDFPPGFYVGLSGIGWAFAELGLEDKAHEAIELAASSPLLSSAPDLFYGLAGFGLSNLYFWRHTQDEKFLTRACDAGDRLSDCAISEGPLSCWKNVDNVIYSGYAHGASGIALFLLALYGETGSPNYLRLAKAAMETEISRAVERDEGLAWERIHADGIATPYWRYGSAGVGSVLIRFFAALRDERYRILAEKAARYVACKYAVFPSQFVGLSGIGDFLLDMYQFSGDSSYLAQADTVASGVLLYKIPRPEGIAFPGEELIRITTDFGTGSAGVAAFLHRRLHASTQKRLIYDCDSLKNSTHRNQMAQAVEA
jgi:class III lanthionine synthetase